MDPITSQTQRYVDQIPGFKDAVVRAKADNPACPSLTVSLSQFLDDPLALYACVLFATDDGVALTFAP